MDITGRLVRLRALRPGDAPRVAECLADPRVTANLASWALHPYSPEKAQEWIADEPPNTVRWAVECLADGELIGTTGLHDITHFSRHCTFGIWLGPPDRWGKGYGTEACMLTVEHGFRHLAMEKVSLYVFAANTNAKRSYEKAGFTTEGVLRRQWWRDGALVDVELMAVFADNPLYGSRIAPIA